MTREERIIAAAVQSRAAWAKLCSLLQHGDLSPQYQHVWDHVSKYYQNDDTSESVDRQLLRDSLTTAFPKHVATFSSIINSLDDVSEENVLDEYVELRKHNIKLDLAAKLLNGGDVEEEILALMSDFQSVDETTRKKSQVVNSPDLADLLSVYSQENLIRVHPQSLNDRLGGGIIRGTQMAVYANTEVGKTLFTINLVGWWLRDGLKVLYLGNEDPKETIVTRVVSNLIGHPKDKILTNIQRAQELAQEKGFDNFYYADFSPGSIAEARLLIEEIRPDVVVYDQMANMEAGKMSKTEKNEWLAAQCRSLAKKYGLVSLIVHQADDDAYGKLVLRKNNMFYTNVGVQAQMDVMIGLGMNDQYEMNNQRMVALPKNKPGNDHGSFPISVDTALSRVL